MVMAPRVFSVGVFVCRAVVVALSAAVLACAFKAPEVNFTALVFLKVAPPALLLWNLPRLLYDAAQVFWEVPLPQRRIVLSVLVFADWVAVLGLFAAASSGTAVLVFFRIDTRACGRVRPGPGACSHWYAAAAGFTLWAWFFSLVVAILMFWLRASIRG